MLIKFKDNKGSALVIVMSVIVIITILVLVLFSLVISELKLLNSEDQMQKSYYLARAGAAAAADWIEKQDFQTVHNYFEGAEGQSTDWQSLEENTAGEFKVKVKIDKESNLLTIESVGRVDKKEKTVKLDMVPETVNFKRVGKYKKDHWY